jgi:hypothetical protein
MDSDCPNCDDLARELEAQRAERDTALARLARVDDALAKNADMHTTDIYRDVRAALADPQRTTYRLDGTPNLRHIAHPAGDGDRS